MPKLLWPPTPLAYSSVLPGESREAISWARFESCDFNDPENYPQVTECESESVPPLLLVLGYGTGVQIWSITGSGDASEVLSWSQGSVRTLRLLNKPRDDQDPFASKRPLVAIVDSSGPGPQFCTVNFVSLKTAEIIKSIKFKTPICDIFCNKKSIVITFVEKIAIFDVGTFEDRMTITTCYPSPGIHSNPVALGHRWLAYAEKRLTTWQRSSGGSEGDGAQSYTATAIHAVKTLGKGLRDLSGSLSGNVPPPVNNNTAQPGVVTIVDIETKPTKEDDVDNIIAHFVAHVGPIVAMKFDSSGLLLITADKHGHRFHVFRIHPHPVSSQLAAVHHLYILHRGDTTAKVQDITVSWDSRWVAVSSIRGTTHVFPITPYGGPVTVRTHTTPNVVNRLSRFERSAGLSDGRGSPLPEVPSQPLNPRLPPYPHPTVLSALAQLRRTPAGEESPLAATFGAARAWIPGRPKGKKPVAESLFVISSGGTLIQYNLDPKCIPGVPKDKISYDTSIELEVEANAEWALLKPPYSSNVQPPLMPNNPLLVNKLPPKIENMSSNDDRWLSQVEIVTHTGPHRRLWMGPQFSFKSIDPLQSDGDVYSENLNPVRSTPVNMPLRPYLLIEGGSGGSIDSPHLTGYGSGSEELGHGESRLREDLADAMMEPTTHNTGVVGGVQLKAAILERQVNPLGTVITLPSNEQLLHHQQQHQHHYHSQPALPAHPVQPGPSTSRTHQKVDKEELRVSKHSNISVDRVCINQNNAKNQSDSLSETTRGSGSVEQSTLFSEGNKMVTDLTKQDDTEGDSPLQVKTQKSEGKGKGKSKRKIRSPKLSPENEEISKPVKDNNFNSKHQITKDTPLCVTDEYSDPKNVDYGKNDETKNPEESDENLAIYNQDEVSDNDQSNKEEKNIASLELKNDSNTTDILTYDTHDDHGDSESTSDPTTAIDISETDTKSEMLVLRTSSPPKSTPFNQDSKPEDRERTTDEQTIEVDSVNQDSQVKNKIIKTEELIQEENVLASVDVLSDNENDSEVSEEVDSDSEEIESEEAVPDPSDVRSSKIKEIVACTSSSEIPVEQRRDKLRMIVDDTLNQAIPIASGSGDDGETSVSQKIHPHSDSESVVRKKSEKVQLQSFPSKSLKTDMSSRGINLYCSAESVESKKQKKTWKGKSFADEKSKTTSKYPEEIVRTGFSGQESKFLGDSKSFELENPQKEKSQKLRSKEGMLSMKNQDQEILYPDAENVESRISRMEQSKKSRSKKEVAASDQGIYLLHGTEKIPVKKTKQEHSQNVKWSELVASASASEEKTPKIDISSGQEICEPCVVESSQSKKQKRKLLQKEKSSVVDSTVENKSRSGSEEEIIASDSCSQVAHGNVSRKPKHSENVKLAPFDECSQKTDDSHQANVEPENVEIKMPKTKQSQKVKLSEFVELEPGYEEETALMHSSAQLESHHSDSESVERQHKHDQSQKKKSVDEKESSSFSDNEKEIISTGQEIQPCHDPKCVVEVRKSKKDRLQKLKSTEVALDVIEREKKTGTLDVSSVQEIHNDPGSEGFQNSKKEHYRMLKSEDSVLDLKKSSSDHTIEKLATDTPDQEAQPHTASKNVELKQSKKEQSEKLGMSEVDKAEIANAEDEKETFITETPTGQEFHLHCDPENSEQKKSKRERARKLRTVESEASNKSPSPVKSDHKPDTDSSDEALGKVTESKTSSSKQPKRKRGKKPDEHTPEHLVVDVEREQVKLKAKSKSEGTLDIEKSDYETCSEKKSDSSVESFPDLKKKVSDSNGNFQEVKLWSSIVKKTKEPLKPSNSAEDRDSVYESCNDEEFPVVEPPVPSDGTTSESSKNEDIAQDSLKAESSPSTTDKTDSGELEGTANSQNTKKVRKQKKKRR
ncbi:titin homolog isoform X2 [Cimex lectularius]|uniref:BCAS3 WD40 domain-containing protein n=1 Tax=Cimex lectularius TaxID=79782 RepID=A0A8I6S121_CIMLE|nr:titin homolog isoform X2 [Cimex lectularius]